MHLATQRNSNINFCISNFHHIWCVDHCIQHMSRGYHQIWDQEKDLPTPFTICNICFVLPCSTSEQFPTLLQNACSGWANFNSLHIPICTQPLRQKMRSQQHTCSSFCWTCFSYNPIASTLPGCFTLVSLCLSFWISRTSTFTSLSSDSSESVFASIWDEIIKSHKPPFKGDAISMTVGLLLKIKSGELDDSGTI